MKPEDLKTLIDQLIAQGEDRDELKFWLDIYPDMPADAQAELVTNLQNELAALAKTT